jgi:hypothetical protein
MSEKSSKQSKKNATMPKTQPKIHYESPSIPILSGRLSETSPILTIVIAQHVT